ncbi:MAG: sigma-70 family RNA polymerase sigma factor [Nocardioidaceae bacterium]
MTIQSEQTGVRPTTSAAATPGTAGDATPATGPGPDFPQATDQYRRELFAHCYRMTGSVHDAEDLVQETYLRAWRAYHAFEGRSSVRTWLHRIATNVCLTALEGRDRRPMPTGLGAPASDPGDPVEANGEVPWLEPAPDQALGDPATLVADRDTVRLAFVAALQHLPARQRAVLVLRDVLRWRAAEVAEAMETTVASVNSALQRAHATLAKADLHEDAVGEPTGAQRQLLDRYVQAFWDKDIDAIVSMLTRDAIWEMPPHTGWYQGAVEIGRLIEQQCPGGPRDMRLVPARANGQPAFGLYMRDGTVFRPFHLQVLTLGAGGVEHVGAFFDPGLFPVFGLPESLPEEPAPATAGPSGS